MNKIHGTLRQTTGNGIKQAGNLFCEKMVPCHEHAAVTAHVRLIGKGLHHTVNDHMLLEAQTWQMQDT